VVRIRNATNFDITLINMLSEILSTTRGRIYADCMSSKQLRQMSDQIKRYFSEVLPAHARISHGPQTEVLALELLKGLLLYHIPKFLNVSVTATIHIGRGQLTNEL